MINASEQLLSEVSVTIYEMFPFLDVEGTKAKLSAIISTYHVQKVEQDEAHPDMHEKIELYLSSKKLEGLSLRTLHGYKLDLMKLAENVKRKAGDVTSADIRVYLAKFEGLKMSTIGTKLSILKSFFSWLASEEIIQRDPTSKLKPPKVEKRMPKSLTIEKLEMLRESCVTVREVA